MLAHAPLPRAAGYSASKAATLSLTRSLRAELREQGTRVLGVLPAFVATRMTEGLDVPKASPEDIVLAALAAVESGEEEVYPDAAARQWVEREIRERAEAVRRLTALA